MTLRIRWLVWAIVLNIILVTAGVAGGEQVLYPRWLLRTELLLQNIGTSTMHRATVEIPLIVEASAYGLVVSEEYNVELEEIVFLDCGTRKGIFRVGSLEPGESMTIRVEYGIAPGATRDIPAEPVKVTSLLIPDSAILGAALRVTDGVTDYEEKFRTLQAFTHQHMRYELNSPWRNGDALKALEQAEGVCEDYANLLVALASALGIPSRTVYGYVKTPRSDNWIRHAWVEYLSLDGQWQSADPTFSPEPGLDDSVHYLGQGYENLSARVRFVGGRLAGSWREDVEELSQQ